MPPACDVEHGQNRKAGFVVTLWKKLQNPFALVGQGFVFGGILFFASVHAIGEAHPADPGEAAPSGQAADARR